MAVATYPSSIPPSVPCEHKIGIGCVLTAVSVCCACADQRPVAPAYPVYVDGEGMRMQGKRWARYCWKCRDFYKFSQHNLSPSPDLTLGLETDMAFRRERAPAQGRLNPQAPTFHTDSTSYPYPYPSGELQQPPASLSTPISISHSHPSDSHHQPPASFSTLPSHSSTGQHHPPARQNIFPLGTREDVEREDYQSPVGLMFQRAYERYRTAEEWRQEQLQTSNPGAPGNDMPMASMSQPPTFLMNSQAPSMFGQEFRPLGAPPRPLPLPGLNFTTQGLAPNTAITTDDEEEDDVGNAIDRQTNRPQPLGREEMIVNVACMICLEQKIDTLMEPCMHLVMCRWCSEEWRQNAIRLRRSDPSAKSPWNCPFCRKGINKTRRVYL